MRFLSTLSLRRATPRVTVNTWQKVFLSTLSLRRATFLSYKVLLAMPFLSTLSLRRATPVSRCYHKCIQNFYPRSPCGERRLPICKYGLPLIFLSTLSLRRATVIGQMTIHTIHISIHALLAESDANRAELNIRQIHFYPRSPCGERQFSYFLHIHRLLFLSTLSLRRATYIDTKTSALVPYFYPRSPCGERRTALSRPLKRYLFLSTLSLRRATAGMSERLIGSVISIHALLAESDGEGV